MFVLAKLYWLWQWCFASQQPFMCLARCPMPSLPASVSHALVCARVSLVIGTVPHTVTVTVKCQFGVPFGGPDNADLLMANISLTSGAQVLLD